MAKKTVVFSLNYTFVVDAEDDKDAEDKALDKFEWYWADERVDITDFVAVVHDSTDEEIKYLYKEEE